MALRTAQVTVTTSATNLTPTVSDDARLDYTVTVNNASGVSIFIGGPSVTTGTGFELGAGRGISFDVRGDGPIYGIVAAGTARADVFASGVS